MNHTTQTQLFDFFERFKNHWQTQKKSLPQAVFEAQWISPCQVGEVENELIFWSPIKREPSVDLSNIEEALDIKLHPSIVDFFCSAYSAGLPATYQNHPIELIQAWNDEDFNLLQENMLAHFMMQKRLKQPASMFIASCSDEMQIVSVLNATGEVQLETLGKGQEAILAANLADFLATLTPVIIE
ncbi:SecY-interacting protein [Psychromonas sp. MB-3u-54]|uniref:SecY-interacting protein n=1 Tax=Psychromonas sp. MB-3u-54 TaxID=2058319 RepID=UPI000C34072C|nr:SecY-interacting protein [Psychromonas sp. MB-3u-54]PKH03780.1 SecY-interacting protein [Psychromonas sp. MB-3u-54]